MRFYKKGNKKSDFRYKKGSGKGQMGNLSAFYRPVALLTNP